MKSQSITKWLPTQFGHGYRGVRVPPNGLGLETLLGVNGKQPDSRFFWLVPWLIYVDCFNFIVWKWFCKHTLVTFEADKAFGFIDETLQVKFNN